MTYHLGQPTKPSELPPEPEDRFIESPTVVDIGIPPLRVTIPVTSIERLKTVYWLTGLVVVLGSIGATAYFTRKTG